MDEKLTQESVATLERLRAILGECDEHQQRFLTAAVNRMIEGTWLALDRPHEEERDDQPPLDPRWGEN